VVDVILEHLQEACASGHNP
jgi:hypothetical protein